MFRENRPRKKDMIRPVCVAAISLVLWFGPMAGGCAKAPKTYRVGILVGTTSMASLADGFRKRMAELGYVEGKTITYDIRYSDADRVAEKNISDTFVSNAVDLIFVFPGQSALIAKKSAMGTKIPVIFANAIIGGTELVDSVRNPGGNITGVRIPSPELSLKSLELILALKPAARKVMIPHDPQYATNGPILNSLRLAAAAGGISLQEVKVSGSDDIHRALSGLEKAGEDTMDAILFLPDSIARSSEAYKAILEFADRHHVPVVGGTPAMVKDGVTLTAAADDVEPGKLAAEIADKILKGTPAASIPVVTTRTHIIINYRKALELGLKPPEGLMKQASEIIR